MDIHSALVYFFIGARRHSDMAEKIFVEALFVFIADLRGDLRNGYVCLFQQ